MAFRRTEPHDYLCLEQRLICLSAVDTDSPLVNGSHCWLWLGGRQRRGDGYGKIAVRDPGGHPRNLLVHRVAYEVFIGPIPDGHEVDHACVEQTCINPAHLSPMTPSDNCIARERRRR